MANKILTPVTLWSDFDDSLPVQATTSDEIHEDKMILRTVRFLGREVGSERVNIYALFGMPETDAECPALLLLPDCTRTVSMDAVRMFVRKGYAVLMPNYRGRTAVPEGPYTVYPDEIAYANYENVGRSMDYAEPTAKETCWYEWVAVARYCVQYLRSISQISKIGVIGIKAGGEIAWQLAATSDDISCAIPVCAGGWRAYRGIYKFADSNDFQMDDERYRFLAGVESQSYAQYVKCPVLMLCATNDERLDADRAFDTYARINAQCDKSFYFAARYNGRIGNSGMRDLELFADKYLKGREVFVPGAADIVIEEDEDGELTSRVRFDPNGEVTYCEVFMAEDCPDAAARDWVRCQFKSDGADHEQIFRMNAFKGASRVFAFAKVKYSCGFVVSSKITVKKIDKQYKNMTDASLVLYSSDKKYDSFIMEKFEQNVTAGCFLNSSVPPMLMVDGPHGIQGIYSPYGLKFFRIGARRYRPSPNALLRMDIYAAKPTVLHMCIEKAENGVSEQYCYDMELKGGEFWTDCVLTAKDFKTEEHKALKQFADSRCISFTADGVYCINNILWI